MHKTSVVRLTLFAVLAVLVCSAGIAVAQDEMKVNADDKPMFVTLPPRLRYDVQAPQTSPLTLSLIHI